MLEILRDKHTYELLTECTIPAPIDVVFSFFSNAENLELLTPEFLRFRILSTRPIEMQKDARIDYRITIHGVAITWKTRIEVWNPPYYFVDRQESGPYVFWRHEHHFETRGSETLMRDRVQYWPKGGRIVHSLFVKKDLLRIFSFRHERLMSHFSNNAEQH